MKKTKLANLLHGKTKIFLIVFGVIITGFLMWLLIRIVSMDTTLTTNNTFTLPSFNSLEDLVELGYGSYAVAIDGEIATGENADEIRATASTAKMILSLAIMREKPFNLGEPGETITITDGFYQRYVDYYNNGGSVSTVVAGEELSEYDALVATLLVSSNNMADSLAIWAFGSLDNYRDYATQMLAEWGINNTTIGIDASGFDESTTSTAKDLATIGTKVMQDPVLSEIVGLKKYVLPVAGEIENTNKILGINNIGGVKTGFIGEVSGYCLVSAYKEGEHIITVALLGAPSRSESFDDSLTVVGQVQDEVKLIKLVSAGEMVGYYDSWWTGPVKIVAEEDLLGLGWAEATTNVDLEMEGGTGMLKVNIGNQTYSVKVKAENYDATPSLIQKIQHAFGWEHEKNDISINQENNSASETNEPTEEKEEADDQANDINITPITKAPSDNCTIKLGTLMLINPNFMVESDFISARRSELVSISELYGIVEGNPYNGDNLLDAEAALHINDMIKAYEAEYPGHTLETRSCFRAVGTKCGRLCAETGASDHHTGLTCDLLDPVYGTELDTDYYDNHIDWQWLKANSYKYGFIDRFPEAWAGGSMSEPLNVDENGSTGLFETWHYRYVGSPAATEIASGKYNNGEYDSLEHYLKSRGLVNNLKAGTCD